MRENIIRAQLKTEEEIDRDSTIKDKEKAKNKSIIIRLSKIKIKNAEDIKSSGSKLLIEKCKMVE